MNRGVIDLISPLNASTTFSFALRTRFGIDAETAPSALYDYYNLDAQAIVMPTRIVTQ